MGLFIIYVVVEAIYKSTDGCIERTKLFFFGRDESMGLELVSDRFVLLVYA